MTTQHTTTPPPPTHTIPPHIFIVGSGLIQYVGAAIAVTLFTVLTPAAVAWWRVLIAAAIFLLWQRPWREKLTTRDIAQSAIFGTAMTAMNMTFYQAIAHLPLGVAVSLEFIGPVSVAIFRGTGWPPRIAAALAFTGVASIGGLGINLTDPSTQIGVAWILIAASMWAIYIILGQHIAAQGNAIRNLALGSTSGAIITAPLFLHTVPYVAGDWKVLIALAGVATLSTALPYTLEALAMQRVSAATFALFAALLPATSTIVGATILRQIPSVGDIIGLILISIAVALTTRANTTRTSQHSTRARAA